MGAEADPYQHVSDKCLILLCTNRLSSQGLGGLSGTNVSCSCSASGCQSTDSMLNWWLKAIIIYTANCSHVSCSPNCKSVESFGPMALTDSIFMMWQKYFGITDTLDSGLY